MDREINIEAICPSVFGIKSRQYRNLAAQGIVPVPVKGKVDFVAATSAYIAHLQDTIQHKGSATEAEARRRKTQAQAEREEIKAARERGELIPRAEVSDEFVKRIYALKTDLLALPRRLSRWPEAKQIVDKALRQLMTNYSKPTGVLKDAKASK